MFGPRIDLKMETKALVSVIIPTYNRGYCLGDAIRSVLSQTVTDFELLVIDDGSTDNTREVVKNFQRTRYFRLPANNGVSTARNFGIQRAKGRYICFLDSDDSWAPGKLEAQVDWMESHPQCDICYTDEIWIRKGVRVNPMKKHQKHSGNIFRHCLPLCTVSPSSVMVRASLFKETGAFDEALPVCEDYDLWLRLSLRRPFHLIRRKLIIKKGGHPDQLSRKFWGMDRFRVYALQKLLQENRLEGGNYQRVVDTLIQKSGVLVKGFLKREKTDEADYYQNLIKKYENKPAL